jgi:hypothetical protein
MTFAENMTPDQVSCKCHVEGQKKCAPFGKGERLTCALIIMAASQN